MRWLEVTLRNLWANLMILTAPHFISIQSTRIVKRLTRHDLVGPAQNSHTRAQECNLALKTWLENTEVQKVIHSPVNLKIKGPNEKPHSFEIKKEELSRKH